MCLLRETFTIRTSARSLTGLTVSSLRLKYSSINSGVKDNYRIYLVLFMQTHAIVPPKYSVRREHSGPLVTVWHPQMTQQVSDGSNVDP